jgi:hypothetical protein
MSARVRLAKQQSTTITSGTTFSVSVKVYYDLATNVVSTTQPPEQLFLVRLNNIDTDETYNSNSGVFLLEEGGQLRVSMTYTGGSFNTGEDLYVQLELY